MSLSELFTLLTGEAAEGEVMSLAGWHTHVPNRLGVMPIAVAMSKAEQVDVVRADGTTITHVFPHEIDWSDKIAPLLESLHGVSVTHLRSLLNENHEQS